MLLIDSERERERERDGLERCDCALSHPHAVEWLREM